MKTETIRLIAGVRMFKDVQITYDEAVLDAKVTAAQYECFSVGVDGLDDTWKLHRDYDGIEESFDLDGWQDVSDSTPADTPTVLDQGGAFTAAQPGAGDAAPGPAGGRNSWPTKR